MPDESFANASAAHSSSYWSTVPWQIWVVILLLAIEGIGDLMLALNGTLAAGFWLAAKFFFVLGLVYRSKLVFVIFLIVAALHIFAFSLQSPFIAFLNLVLVLLVASTLGQFFPSAGPEEQ